MIDVETSLRDAFRRHETALAVDDGRLSAAIDRAGQRQRRRRLAAGGLVAVVVTGLITANARRDVVGVATIGPGDASVVTTMTLLFLVLTRRAPRVGAGRSRLRAGGNGGRGGLVRP